jgi:hypothetical protein
MDDSRQRAWVSWLVLAAIAVAVAVMVMTLMRPGPVDAPGDGMLPSGHAASRRLPRPA